MKNRFLKFISGVVCAFATGAFLSITIVFVIFGKFELSGTQFSGITGTFVALGSFVIALFYLYVGFKNFGVLPQAIIDKVETVFHPGDEPAPNLGCGTGCQCHPEPPKSAPDEDMGGVLKVWHK